MPECYICRYQFKPGQKILIMGTADIEDDGYVHHREHHAATFACSYEHLIESANLFMVRARGTAAVDLPMGSVN